VDYRLEGWCFLTKGWGVLFLSWTTDTLTYFFWQRLLRVWILRLVGVFHGDLVSPFWGGNTFFKPPRGLLAPWAIVRAHFRFLPRLWHSYVGKRVTPLLKHPGGVPGPTWFTRGPKIAPAACSLVRAPQIFVEEHKNEAPGRGGGNTLLRRRRELDHQQLGGEATIIHIEGGRRKILLCKLTPRKHKEEME